MKIRDLSWFQVEEYLRRDDRAVVPLGSTEQHAYLSLLTDAILAERVALDAAEPLGVPVYPALPFGISSYFLGLPRGLALIVAPRGPPAGAVHGGLPVERETGRPPRVTPPPACLSARPSRRAGRSGRPGRPS
jgi:hypothetical protein